MVEARDAVEAVDLLEAVDWARVQAFGFFGRVLDLQAGFYVLYRRGDEGDCRTGHYTCHGVPDGGEFVDRVVGEGELGLCEAGRCGGHALWIEECLVQDAAVEG